jgi:hypothetical protein
MGVKGGTLSGIGTVDEAEDVDVSGVSIPGEIVLMPI